ncbi:unknown [Bacteroides sp. CAG:633]|nr:unknown [Bacteroides sp. CAG:633]
MINTRYLFRKILRLQPININQSIHDKIRQLVKRHKHHGAAYVSKDKHNSTKNDRETATNTISTIHTIDKVPLSPLQSASLVP